MQGLRLPFSSSVAVVAVMMVVMVMVMVVMMMKARQRHYHPEAVVVVVMVVMVMIRPSRHHNELCLLEASIILLLGLAWIRHRLEQVCVAGCRSEPDSGGNQCSSCFHCISSLVGIGIERQPLTALLIRWQPLSR